MKIKQFGWTGVGPIIEDVTEVSHFNADLVLVFGCRELIASHPIYEQVNGCFPNAQVVTCSTSGEILDTTIYDQTFAITAIDFEKTDVVAKQINIRDFGSSEEAGEVLAKQFALSNLQHLFVLSDGQLVNGSALVRGLTNVLHSDVAITGGLAGDGDRFTETLVGLNQQIEPGAVVGIGFYGSALRTGFGSLGGWDAFGPLRRITKSDSNVLYELDGQSALSLYKQYLGDKASELPGSGLLFPLALTVSGQEEPVVRTILSVDEETNSMTFAGEMPEGAQVQLMRASFDKLVDGAIEAASASRDSLGPETAELIVCVSCVGRRLVLGQKAEDEIEGVREILGDTPVLTGFYSYGEISPFVRGHDCRLHNQTMTVTCFKEVETS